MGVPLYHEPSGQGEIPDRRYSPRAKGTRAILAPGTTRSSSGTDGISRAGSRPAAISPDGRRPNQKRRDQTKTYLFTAANKLCKQYDSIGVGDYAPRGGGCTTGMRRAMNNQSLIGRFKQVMEWMASRSGKVYVKYDEESTTRTCHVCQHRVTDGIPVEVRAWTCPVCRTHHLRDENAAQNGVGRVLEEIVLPCPGHTLVKITARWAWQVSPSGVLVTPRGCDDSAEEAGHCQEIKPGLLLPGPDPVVACA